MSDLLTFSAHGTAETAARTTVRTRDFSLVVDEPPALGGDDLGANPVEYLLAGFAGCLNVVGHLVAQDQGLDLRALDVEVSGPLDPARLFGEATDGRAGFQHIEVVLRVDADADADALEAWVRAVEARCPISDNLRAPTPVHLSVARQTLQRSEAVAG